MDDVIVLSKICKTYYTKGGCVNALINADLHIRKGEFVAVIGQSGSGKSTLMNILGCLDTPSSGEYFLDSKLVGDMNEHELSYFRNNVIGFIFQGFNLIPTLTAQENVELPLFYRGIKKQTRAGIAANALKRVGLEHRATHMPNELSGGQQQRVAIARAVAANPKLILADEPTGNLDSQSGFEIMQLLKNLNTEGTTVVLITHDNQVAAMAQRCIRIADGKIQPVNT